MLLIELIVNHQNDINFAAPKFLRYRGHVRSKQESVHKRSALKTFAVCSVIQNLIPIKSEAIEPINTVGGTFKRVCDPTKAHLFPRRFDGERRYCESRFFDCD